MDEWLGTFPLAYRKLSLLFLKRKKHVGAVAICGSRVNKGADMGLENPVYYKLYGEKRYLRRLDELIRGSESAV